MKYIVIISVLFILDAINPNYLYESGKAFYFVIMIALSLFIDIYAYFFNKRKIYYLEAIFNMLRYIRRK